jgi:hypothetical protein
MHPMSTRQIPKLTKRILVSKAKGPSGSELPNLGCDGRTTLLELGRSPSRSSRALHISHTGQRHIRREMARHVGRFGKS